MTSDVGKLLIMAQSMAIRIQHRCITYMRRQRLEEKQQKELRFQQDTRSMEERIVAAYVGQHLCKSSQQSPYWILRSHSTLDMRLYAENS